MEYIEFYKIAYGWLLSVGMSLLYLIGIITLIKYIWFDSIIPIYDSIKKRASNKYSTTKK